MRATSVFRHSEWDAVLIALSVIHGALLVVAPSAALVAIGLWWSANTVSHCFIHLPFFRSRRANAAYSIYLSAVLGIPQSLWRARHLRHHASGEHAIRWTTTMSIESGVVLAIWMAAAVEAPRIFFGAYLPGYAIGLGLCFLQGHFEHARGTTSHYGGLYNVAFFNDGYHVEHHARPGEHWTRLPRRGRFDPQSSRWPPVLRWLEQVAACLAWAPRPVLGALERLVLVCPELGRFVLDRHARAMRALMPDVSRIRRVTIVGGGLYPRTALIVRALIPDATITIVDANSAHLRIARRLLARDEEHERVRYVHATYDSARPVDTDLLVIPLAFVGDRTLVYQRPPARAVLIHDWLWSTSAGCVSASTTRVSWLLLKRLSLVEQAVAARRTA